MKNDNMEYKFKQIHSQQNIQLINELKSIIDKQEQKIETLQQDLKRWQKKYRIEPQNMSIHHQNSTNSKGSTYDIATINEKIASILKQSIKNISLPSFHPNEISIKPIFKLVENLCIKINDLSQKLDVNENRQKMKQEQINKLNNKIDAILDKYETTLKKSEEYEYKLLKQIKRQEQIIKRIQH